MFQYIGPIRMFFRFQVDGEVWTQPNICKLRVCLKQPRSQVVMLKRIEHGIAEKAFVQILNSGMEDGTLEAWQRDVLLRKMEASLKEERERRGGLGGLVRRVRSWVAAET